MSELLREELLKKLPYVSILTGTQDFEALPRLVLEACADRRQRVLFSSPSPHFLERGYRREGRVSTYLPITFGCDNFCSYCVVPYTTGPQRSKPKELILGELSEILQEGFREVILLGQNVNSYGKDFGNPCAFEDLLLGIEESFRGVPLWIRFITSHPKDMRREIVELVRESTLFCPYFHLPLQAGSDRILALMNRGYTKSQYLEMALFIRERIPEAAIGTDVIVGFPTESDRDFEDTLEVVQRVEFEIAYTYTYSPRPRTKAAELKDDVPQEVKRERLEVLSKVLKEGYTRRLHYHEGRRAEVLAFREDGKLVGKTRENLRVLLEDAEVEEGRFSKVVLEVAPEGKLVGCRLPE
jgi:tRNA-2-methylthio-N6-dimethylallyladenosine synthase